MYTIDMLLRDIDHQKTALFIGAGAARCNLMPFHQLPDGKEMKLGIYKYRYGYQKNFKEYEEIFKGELEKKWSKKGLQKSLKNGYITPEVVWGECLAEDGEKLTPYITLLDNMFGKEKYIPPNYKFMAWLNLMDEPKIHQIITTNFDEKIEGAYKLLQSRGLFTNINVLTAASNDDFAYLTEKLKNTRIIYKLHGTISKPFTIRSSLADMNKPLPNQKYEALKNIFESNGLVIFVGYACNDNDIYNALKKISKDGKVGQVKIVWIKRDPKIKKNSNIYKILESFDSTENILSFNSYDFFKKFFDTFVDREKISMPLMEHHKKFINNIVIKDTQGIIETCEKLPLRDVLYRKIEYPREYKDEIFKIINSFDMQRLRDIKQLSFAQYMYPSATHTRFSHSLGVAYLVSRALANPNLANVDDEDKKNTIYAALLHDVGHGPLGHVLDKFYDRLQKGNEHEKFTKKFIDDGLIDLQDVLKKVNMNFTEVKDRTVFKSQNSEDLLKYSDKLHLAWLITDYALDLDRIDFLMRDLLMTSYNYQSNLPSSVQRELFGQEISCRDILNGIISDFISRLCLGTTEELDHSCRDRFPEEARILYIGNKGRYAINELIEFLLGIYVEMYSNVYYHDRISCAEAMMAKALHIAYDAGDIDRSHLYTFTDSELISYLENLENDLIREIVYSVKYRRLFKPVVQFDLDLPKNISAVSVEDEIERCLGLDQNDYRSLAVVNIPRKKELRNLFIRTDDKIVSYPHLQHYRDMLSKNIKGKIFIHPKSELYTLEDEKQRLVDLLKNMGINAEITSNVSEKNPKQQPTLDLWSK